MDVQFGKEVADIMCVQDSSALCRCKMVFDLSCAVVYPLMYLIERAVHDGFHGSISCHVCFVR